MMTENQIGGGSNNNKSNPYLGIAPFDPDVTVCPDPKECPSQEPSGGGLAVSADVMVCPDPKECPSQEVTPERNAA